MSSTPDTPATTSGSAATSSHKHTRVLACVLCQHRKIKCDRNSPCANCIKANVTCTPSTPAPARKRRRPNQDLQERLARCEKLLQQYASTGSPPPQSTVQSSPPSPETSRPDVREPSVLEPVTPVANSDNESQRWKASGRIVHENGGARFMDSQIIASMSEELQAMRSLMEAEEPDEGSVISPEALSPDNHTDLLMMADPSKVQLEDYLPDPVVVFRLWQIFLDRVNPLIKIIHVPSLQPYVVDITSNMSSVPLNYQALLFSILTMATVSLTHTECVQTLGISREKAIQNFITATKSALVRFDYLRCFNMVALQALLFYLSALEGRYDRHAAWVIFGSIMRIAQKMGYHRDGEALNLTPFETEMRRRIWWHLLMMDGKLANLSGLNISPIRSDTKLPLNVNDADLFPGSTEPVQARDGPTEMIFALMMHEIQAFNTKLDHNDFSTKFEAAVLGQELEGEADSRSAHIAFLNAFREQASVLERRLREIQTKYCDPAAGNVHIAAMTILPRVTCHLDEVLVPMREQPEWGTEIFGPKDVLFKLIILSNEHRAETFNQMARSGFLWFVSLHFQDEMFAVLTAQLYQRPKGTLSDRAWKVVGRTYEDHKELLDVSQKRNSSQAQQTLKAWRAREAAFAQGGWPLQEPTYITRLKELLPAPDTSSTASSSTRMGTAHLPQRDVGVNPMLQEHGMELDPFVGGYLDASAINWDMLGDVMNNSDPLSGSMFNYGLGNMNLNMGNMNNTGDEMSN